MSHKPIFLLVLLCTVLGSCDRATRPTWFKYQGNRMNWGQAQEDGATNHVRYRKNLEAGPRVGCPILWSDSNHRSFNDSRIIMGAGVKGLGRFVPLQGQENGFYSSGHSISDCPVAGPDGAIYGSTLDGFVFAVSSDLNNELWKRELPGGDIAATSPNVLGDLLFVGKGKTLYALRTKDGKILWEHRMPADIFHKSCPPTTLESDNSVLIADLDGNIAKLGTTDHEVVLWEIRIPDVAIASHLMVDPNDSLYVAGSDGVMRVLDLANGQEKWSLATGIPHHLTGVALSANARTAFFADQAGTLYAVDIPTRKELWRTKLPGPPTTPPIVTPQEMIYIGVGNSVRDSAVVAVNRQGVKWTVPAPSGLVEFLAVGEDGTVYASAGSDLIAIK